MFCYVNEIYNRMYCYVNKIYNIMFCYVNEYIIECIVM